MYYNNKHQRKIISSSRMFISSESHLQDSGLILSTDAKPRLKWTQDLHERFVEAVNQLGGGEKATPKTIMKVMGIPGLTLYHLKSHLQKYRLSKNLNGQTNTSSNKIGLMTMIEEKTQEAYHNQILSLGLMPNMNLPINDALQLQIDVQRRLHEQLELRIEAQGKYLQTILEKAQETLGRQNLSKAAIETTKEIIIMEEELPWTKEHLSENPKPKISPSRKSHGRLSIEMGLQEHKRTHVKTEYTEERIKDCKVQTRIDLNIHDENYVIRNPKHFDLNGFSWN